MLTLKNPIFCSADLNIPYHASAVETIGNGVTLNTTPPPLSPLCPMLLKEVSKIVPKFKFFLKTCPNFVVSVSPSTTFSFNKKFS